MDTTDTDERTPDLDSGPGDFRTDSLDLAAWLVCQGFPLQRLDPPASTSSRPHARFVFSRTDELTAAVSSWESGQPIHGTDLRRYISVKKDLYGRARRVVAKKGER